MRQTRSLRVPPEATRVSIDTPRGPLAALTVAPSGSDADPGAPPHAPVVLIPGFTGSKEDFLAILAPLARAGHRVVAYDQRGQFETPGPECPDPYRLDALASDALAVADFAGVPVHLVGHSFGGLVARAAALRAPSALRSLVLLDSGPAAISGPRRVAIEQMRPVLAHGGLPAVWAATEQEPDLPPEVARFLEQRFLASSAASLDRMGEQLRSEPDRTAELAAVLRARALPALVVHGADDDAWFPDEQAAMAARLGAAHEVIEDAAHSPAVENPAALVAALLAFFAAAEAAAA